jgi:fused signal recognition particle receptor
VRTTEEILERIRQRVERHQLADAAELKGLIREQLLEILAASERAPARVAEPPAVVLVVGVNGSGKTTTIGKLGQRFKNEQRSSCCAPPTPSAPPPSSSSKSGASAPASPVVRQGPGSDPSAVLFDAVQAAAARKVDYVLVDTAGRLQTKENLMAGAAEDEPHARKVIPGAPHEVLLVLDATTGQNGLEQARKFTETSGVTGIVLTKLDGTAKGGIVVAIARELNLPIRYVGVGEKVEDLLPFDAEKFIQSLFEK